MSESTSQKGRAWLRALSGYTDTPVVALALFGIPYGMMYFLIDPIPKQWLYDVGYAKETIGFFSLVSLPYVLKFLWAPFVDFIKLPFLHGWLGQRRSWLLLSHLMLMLGLTAIAFTSPERNIFWISLFASLSAMFAATQDIIVDTYRIEVLSHDKEGPGAGMLIFGYRVGSVIARAGSLHLAHAYSWQAAYLVMACLVVIGVVMTFLIPEPKPVTHKPPTLWATTVEPFKEFVSRSGWVWALLFILLYRLGDNLISNMVDIFHRDLGFSKVEIANVTKTFGVIATILGGFWGGLLVSRLGVFRGLLVAGVVHTVSNLFFIVQTYVGYNIPFLYLSVAIENSTGGMSTVAFIVFLSRLCDKQYTATQYALFSSLWSAGTVIASCGGHFATLLGWQGFFFMTVLIALPSLFLIPILSKHFSFMKPTK